MSLRMKGRLILAEAATAHNDGTISMLRAGINSVKAAKLPIILKGALVASIFAEASERGTHNFELSCLDEDGGDRMPTIKGSFEVPQTGGNNNLIIAFSKKLEGWGAYQFNLLIDRQEQDSFTLMVENIEKTDDGSPRTAD